MKKILLILLLISDISFCQFKPYQWYKPQSWLINSGTDVIVSYSYHSETIRIATYMNDISDGRKKMLDSLIRNLIDSVNLMEGTSANTLRGVGFDVFCLYANYSESASLKNLVVDSNHTTNNGCSFAIDKGFTGGTGKYMNANFNVSYSGINFTRNSASYFVYALKDGISANIYICGGIDNSANGGYMGMRYTTGYAFGYVNSNQIYAQCNVTTSNGFQGVSRTTNAIQKLYRNADSIATETVSRSVALPNIPFYILAAYYNGSAVGNTANQVSFLAIGKGFKTNTIRAIYNCIETFWMKKLNISVN